MTFRFSVAVVIIVAALDLSLAAASPTAKQVRRLGTYSIQSNRIFVAGISSGGAMAVQLQVRCKAQYRKPE